MKLIFIFIIWFALTTVCYGAPDTLATRSTNYAPGNVVKSGEVNTNELAIFNAYNAHSHAGVDSTTSTTFTIGDDDDVNHSYIVNNGDTNNPRLRYNATNSEWEFTNNGTTYFPIQASASVAGILDGFEFFYDRVNPADAIIASGGSVVIGGTYLQTTAVSESLAVGSDGFWIGGSATDSASTWIYVYVFDSSSVASFNFSTTAPNSIDEQGNTGGRPKWLVSSGVAYRCIGAVRNNPKANIASFNMVGNMVMWNDPIVITTTVSAGAWSSALSCSAGMPEISTMGIFGLFAQETDNELGVWIIPNGGFEDSSPDPADGFFHHGSGASAQKISDQRWAMTDTAQQVKYYNSTGNDATEINVMGYKDYIH